MGDDAAAVEAPAAAPRAERLPWPLIGIALAGVSVIALALLIGPPVLVLAACVVSGFGMTYLSGVALTLEERVAFGTVLGAVVLTALSFVFSLVAHDVTVLSVLTASALAAAGGVAAAWRHRSSVIQEWSDLRSRWSPRINAAGHPWPLFAIVLVCGAWTIHFLHQA